MVSLKACLAEARSNLKLGEPAFKPRRKTTVDVNKGSCAQLSLCIHNRVMCVYERAKADEESTVEVKASNNRRRTERDIFDEYQKNNQLVDAERKEWIVQNSTEEPMSLHWLSEASNCYMYDDDEFFEMRREEKRKAIHEVISDMKQEKEKHQTVENEKMKARQTRMKLIQKRIQDAKSRTETASENGLEETKKPDEPDRKKMKVNYNNSG
ncbi:uncharacterized protein LOC126318243 isoform X1 [Schistocerca gregaria]|uniref:uncharacterized protein LOC126318243 isoform X1 n=1 Tax=Schistocerca gregaria TaxID=7010 RepID=UPI00211E5300|nr:uncharacterized protein LOC126318243 isoform X1 [Schistocerca gregaria]